MKKMFLVSVLYSDNFSMSYEVQAENKEEAERKVLNDKSALWIRSEEIKTEKKDEWEVANNENF